MFNCCVYYLGLAVILAVVGKAAWIIYLAFFAKVDLSAYKKKDSWAVVTGSTDGIGFSYAKKLAKEGFNIALVGRNAAKLEDCKKAIEKLYSTIRVKTIVSEASNCTKENIQNVVKELSGLNVTILINNVGVSGEFGAEFIDWSIEDIHKTINVNCLYTCHLTHQLIPLMKKQAKSLIVIVSSVAGEVPIPYFGVYCASKAFLTSFGQSLNIELSSQGVRVHVVEPGMVKTNMNPRAESIECLSSDAFADYSLKTMDRERVSSPYPIHALTIYAGLMVSKIMPDSVIRFITRTKVIDNKSK